MNYVLTRVIACNNNHVLPGRNFVLLSDITWTLVWLQGVMSDLFCSFLPFKTQLFVFNMLNNLKKGTFDTVWM